MANYALKLRATFIRPENPTVAIHALRRLGNAARTDQLKTNAKRISGKGRGVVFFGLHSRREQRSVVKVSYTKNTQTRSWAAHGEYLQREHAQAAGRKGAGFDAHANEIDISATLRTWQNSGDEHFFKVILSPESG